MARYRKKFSRNGITRKFQWFFDFNTDTEQITQVRVTSGGQDVVARLRPFFTAFKYYKLGSTRIRILPAPTLPVDPTGLSYGAGEQYVDPRDQFNAGLIRITNGEDFDDRFLTVGNEVPNGDGSSHTVTDQEVERIYYQMMLDPRWYKFSMGRGVTRYATPRYWQVGQLHQDSHPGATINVPMDEITSAGSVKYNPGSGVVQFAIGDNDGAQANVQTYIPDYSSSRGLFQTGVKGRLDWLPTDQLVKPLIGSGDAGIPFGGITSVPEIELMRIFLPKAYKTKYYFRMIVEETVHFRAPVDTYAIFETEGMTSNPDNGAIACFMPDRFVLPTSVELGNGNSAMFTYPTGDDGDNTGDQL